MSAAKDHALQLRGGSRLVLPSHLGLQDHLQAAKIPPSTLRAATPCFRAPHVCSRTPSLPFSPTLLRTQGLCYPLHLLPLGRPLHSAQPPSGSAARRFPISLAASLNGDFLDQASCIAEAAQTLESLWGSGAPDLCLLWPSAPAKRPGRLLLEQSAWVPWDHLPAGPREVFVYTDGSKKGSSGAGAAVVFTQGDHGEWRYHGAIVVRADDWLQQWECCPTSASMESCALCAALCWALRLESGSQCHLLSDGLTSLQAMQGFWAIPESSAGGPCRFAAASRVLFRLGEILGLGWHPLHTPGHAGHAGNELVDAFARSALQGETSPGWGQALRSKLNSEVRDWLWMLPRSARCYCLPTV